ncbi:MAG: response regulator [Rhodospirillales bacterium]|nr:response regulator [Rhodospirillales bacterium]
MIDPILAEMSRLRVLLCEDEKFALKLEKMVLKQLNIEQITVAEDGAEALRQIEERGHEFDLVISDWNMPYITGVELLKLIRQKDNQLAFIMVTGNATLDNVKEALGNGVDAYIVKPFSLDQMRAKILSVLQKRKVVRS